MASAVLPQVFSSGCDDPLTDAAETVCCDDSALPVFLRSKTDDEDGDGNPFDEDFPRINDEDDDIADHAWIRDDNGLYHLFFHTEDLGSGTHIEHYVSTDLLTLDYVGPALYGNPNGWDSYGLWAPHVIRSGSTYFMFYTGIDGPGTDPDTRQRIGLAESSDLMGWTRCPVNDCPGTSGDGCVYECDEDWTGWGGPPGSYNQQCRDPFVIRDPVNQRWTMFATASRPDRSGVVTVAYSTDLADWTGAGFIDATGLLPEGIGGQPTGGQAENPHVMSYGGTHYLLFTDWQDPEDSVSTPNPRTIVQYATSSALTADTLGSPGWIYRGYIPDPGVNAIEVLRIDDKIWVMSQSISNERSGYWDLRRHLRFRCVIWSEDHTFGASNVDFHCNAVRRARGPGGFAPGFGGPYR
ncbi:MAG: family 43 glycosylhydrolase [Candidatus Krumholzibacteria bacterium]|nr:family 43 glycosylhydrolase [Candidatus Krumholzibacteria bacterium]